MHVPRTLGGYMLTLVRVTPCECVCIFIDGAIGATIGSRIHGTRLSNELYIYRHTQSMMINN